MLRHSGGLIWVDVNLVWVDVFFFRIVLVSET